MSSRKTEAEITGEARAVGRRRVSQLKAAVEAGPALRSDWATARRLDRCGVHGVIVCCFQMDIPSTPFHIGVLLEIGVNLQAATTDVSKAHV